MAIVCVVVVLAFFTTAGKAATKYEDKQKVQCFRQYKGHS